MSVSNPKKQVSSQTFRLDLINSSLGGILEVGFGTFAILIAIRFLQAPDMIKAMLASGVSAGLLLVPHMQRLAAWTEISASRFCASLMYILPSPVWYRIPQTCMDTVHSFVPAQVCFSQLPGFMIQVYSKNYDSKERGKRLSELYRFCLSGMILSYGGGSYLDAKSADFGLIFRIMGMVALVSA